MFVGKYKKNIKDEVKNIYINWPAVCVEEKNAISGLNYCLRREFRNKFFRSAYGFYVFIRIEGISSK